MGTCVGLVCVCVGGGGEGISGWVSFRVGN